MNDTQLAEAAKVAVEEYGVWVTKTKVVIAIRKRLPYVTLLDAKLMVEAIDRYEDQIGVAA